MSKELSAEEIISLIISNTASQFSAEWKPDIVYTKEELIEIVESFATKRVKEANRKQRNLCAEEWNSKHGAKFSDSYNETVMSEIRNAPEPL